MRLYVIATNFVRMYTEAKNEDLFGHSDGKKSSIAMKDIETHVKGHCPELGLAPNSKTVRNPSRSKFFFLAR